MTEDFDLLISPAEVRNVAVGELARQVAGAIKTRARLSAEGIGNESL